MSFTAVIPTDTSREIARFLASLESQPNLRRVLQDAILDAISTLTVNPYLGSSVPGGPFEHRRFYRFVVEAGGARHALEFAYRINEATEVVVFGGFGTASA
jgi:hypothetical protein